MNSSARFIAGWTLHASPAMPEGMETRYALTITYFADDGVGARATTKVLPKRLQKFVETEDEMAYKGWINVGFSDVIFLA